MADVSHPVLVQIGVFPPRFRYEPVCLSVTENKAIFSVFFRREKKWLSYSSDAQSDCAALCAHLLLATGNCAGDVSRTSHWTHGSIIKFYFLFH